MKMAQAFSPEMKDANLDWESITAMIQEGERGKIVEVEDEVQHKTVEVWWNNSPGRHLVGTGKRGCGHGRRDVRGRIRLDGVRVSSWAGAPCR
jgi:hypothetical protein